MNQFIVKTDPNLIVKYTKWLRITSFQVKVVFRNFYFIECLIFYGIIPVFKIKFHWFAFFVISATVGTLPVLEIYIRVTLIADKLTLFIWNRYRVIVSSAMTTSE